MYSQLAIVAKCCRRAVMDQSAWNWNALVTSPYLNVASVSFSMEEGVTHLEGSHSLHMIVVLLF